MIEYEEFIEYNVNFKVNLNGTGTFFHANLNVRAEDKEEAKERALELISYELKVEDISQIEILQIELSRVHIKNLFEYFKRGCKISNN